MPAQLQGLNVIVTGASSGNGRAIALAYATEGANVLCSDVQPDALTGGYYETAKRNYSWDLLTGRLPRLHTESFTN